MTLVSRQNKQIKSLGDGSGGKMFVDHLLLVDQVGRLHHKVHKLVGVATPRVESLQRILTKINELERLGTNISDRSTILKC